jgi:hypothetical protein
MIHLAGIQQLLALVSAQIQTVEFLPVESEAGDRQGLALGTGFLEPIVTATGDIAAIPNLGDDAFEAGLAGVLVHLLTVDLKALAELDIGVGDDLLELRTIFLDWPFSSFCSTEKSVVPSVEGTTTSPSMIADPALTFQASTATLRKQSVQSWPRRVKIFAVSLAR